MGWSNCPPCHSQPGCAPADRVQIVGALMAGQLGIYQGMRPRERIEILLSMLGAPRSVVLAQGDIAEA